LCPPGTRVADIMVREVTVLPQTATVMDACEFFILHRLLAFPVVDPQRRIIGVVDVELYTSELTDLDRTARSDDLFQLVGVHYAEAQLASPLRAFRTRFPWLLANVAGGVLAALLLGVFQADLQHAVALALFIPVVLTVSEGVSMQSVSLALQALHGQRPRIRSILRKARWEAVTGVFLGVACAGLVAGVARIWLGPSRVAFILFGGIVGSVACATVIGVLVPNLLRLLRQDPRVAAGPLALASADMATLLVYFSLAHWLL
jgi:magnesium transporter